MLRVAVMRLRRLRRRMQAGFCDVCRFTAILRGRRTPLRIRRGLVRALSIPSSERPIPGPLRIARPRFSVEFATTGETGTHGREREMLPKNHTAATPPPPDNTP